MEMMVFFFSSLDSCFWEASQAAWERPGWRVSSCPGNVWQWMCLGLYLREGGVGFLGIGGCPKVVAGFGP